MLTYAIYAALLISIASRPRTGCLIFQGTPQFLQLNNVGCCRTFGTVYDLKLDPSPFIEGFIALTIYGRMMNENITAFIRFNKTKTFCRIKPLHFTFNHFTTPWNLAQRGAIKNLVFPTYAKTTGKPTVWTIKQKKTALPRLRGLCG